MRADDPPINQAQEDAFYLLNVTGGNQFSVRPCIRFARRYAGFTGTIGIARRRARALSRAGIAERQSALQESIFRSHLIFCCGREQYYAPPLPVCLWIGDDVP